MTFNEYMDRVDALIGRVLGGMTHRDIADWHWYDAFDSEMSPRLAVIEALREEGFV
jgi:hypothetical protein